MLVFVNLQANLVKILDQRVQREALIALLLDQKSFEVPGLFLHAFVVAQLLLKFKCELQHISKAISKAQQS